MIQNINLNTYLYTCIKRPKLIYNALSDFFRNLIIFRYLM